MTKTPATENVRDDNIDTDQTRALRTEMVDSLVRDGILTDEQWAAAFLTVPRHVLVPDYDEAGTRIDYQSNPETWLHEVYSARIRRSIACDWPGMRTRVSPGLGRCSC